MKILTDKEFDWVRSLTGPQTYRLEVSVHEAGHALIMMHYGFTFEKVCAEISDTGKRGLTQVSGCLMQDGWTIRQGATVSVGGWAALEVFGNISIDIYSKAGCRQDVQDIKNMLTTQKLEAIIDVVQPEAKRILSARVETFKKLAFALYKKGTLTYDECQELTPAVEVIKFAGHNLN